MQTVLVQLDANVSPELAFGLKNYLIDIDGTITDDVPNEQPERMSVVEPFEGSVDMINSWYEEGHVITFFTSRTDEHELVTKQWLEKWNFKYHNIIFNKPRGLNSLTVSFLFIFFCWKFLLYNKID